MYVHVQCICTCTCTMYMAYQNYIIIIKLINYIYSKQVNLCVHVKIHNYFVELVNKWPRKDFYWSFQTIVMNIFLRSK